MQRDVLAVPCVVDFAHFPAPSTKAAMGLDPDVFSFLYVFDANSSIIRKNPEGAIEAFARAFRPSDKVRLMIKASNAHRREHAAVLRRLQRQASATGLDIRFLYGHMKRDELMGLLSAVDCYVSLHRAEGFGYTCAEAMFYQRPTIATRYSGNLDFMNDDNSLLVDCEECEVSEPDGPFLRGSVWAAPDLDHAASQMRRVFEDREHATAIGRLARQSVIERLSAEAIGKLIEPRLKGVPC